MEAPLENEKTNEGSKSLEEIDRDLIAGNLAPLEVS
jgi:hypothetical protein